MFPAVSLFACWAITAVPRGTASWRTRSLPADTRNWHSADVPRRRRDTACLLPATVPAGFWIIGGAPLMTTKFRRGVRQPGFAGRPGIAAVLGLHARFYGDSLI